MGDDGSPEWHTRVANILELAQGGAESCGTCKSILDEVTQLKESVLKWHEAEVAKKVAEKGSNGNASSFVQAIDVKKAEKVGQKVFSGKPSERPPLRNRAELGLPKEAPRTRKRVAPLAASVPAEGPLWETPPPEVSAHRTLATIWELGEPVLKGTLSPALQKTHLSLIVKKLKGGDDANTWDGPESPLVSSINAGHLDMVHILLKLKADPNSLDASEVPALHLAAKFGHLHICRELLGARANVNMRNEATGRTALFLASRPPICDELVRAGAEARALDNTGQSALHALADAERFLSVDWLSARVTKAFLDHRDEKGRTVAMVLFKKSYKKPNPFKRKTNAAEAVGDCDDVEQTAVNVKVAEPPEESIGQERMVNDTGTLGEEAAANELEESTIEAAERKSHLLDENGTTVPEGTEAEAEIVGQKGEVNEPQEVEAEEARSQTFGDEEAIEVEEKEIEKEISVDKGDATETESPTAISTTEAEEKQGIGAAPTEHEKIPEAKEKQGIGAAPTEHETIPEEKQGIVAAPTEHEKSPEETEAAGKFDETST